MIFKAKVGNDDVYVEIVAYNIAKIIAIADEEAKKNNFKILEIRNNKGQLIDIDKYRRKMERAKEEIKIGYIHKETIPECYRSVQQAMWFKYDQEEYEKIKVELKKIKDSSKNIDEFKKKLVKYIESLENKGI